MVFDRLFRDKRKPPQRPPLAMVRNVTIGRTVVLDPLAWRRLGQGAIFGLETDTLEITAQGLVKLNEGGFVHRFYTDDHLMFQAVSDDPSGDDANDFTLFMPWASHYPGDAAAKVAWLARLRAASFTDKGLPEYQRLWFEDETGEQPPVTFWEEIFDDRTAETPYARIFQTCMLYARDIGLQGRELLLAIAQETEGGELTHEIMVGVPLALGEFKA